MYLDFRLVKPWLHCNSCSKCKIKRKINNPETRWCLVLYCIICCFALWSNFQKLLIVLTAICPSVTSVLTIAPQCKTCFKCPKCQINGGAQKDHFICTGLQKGERFVLKKKVCDWFGLKLTLLLPTEIWGGIIFHSLPIFALLVGMSQGSAKVKKKQKNCRSNARNLSATQWLRVCA